MPYVFQYQQKAEPLLDMGPAPAVPMPDKWFRQPPDPLPRVFRIDSYAVWPVLPPTIAPSVPSVDGWIGSAPAYMFRPVVRGAALGPYAVEPTLYVGQNLGWQQVEHLQPPPRPYFPRPSGMAAFVPPWITVVLPPSPDVNTGTVIQRGDVIEWWNTAEGAAISFALPQRLDGYYELVRIWADGPVAPVRTANIKLLDELGHDVLLGVAAAHALGTAVVEYLLAPTADKRAAPHPVLSSVTLTVTYSHAAGRWGQIILHRRARARP